MYDLRHPNATPTKAGDTDSFTAFVSGENFWALQDASGTHVFRSSDGVSEPAGTFEHLGDPAGGLVATDTTLLAFTRGPNGSLADLRRVDP